MSSAPSDKDSATYRLRSHIREQNKDSHMKPLDRLKAGKEGKAEGKKETKYTKGKNSDLNMDQLLVHIKEAQEKKGQSLMKAIELSEKELKINLEEVSTTLRDSEGSIRSDLNRIEETFGTKIQRLQTDLVTAENQLTVTAGKVSVLEEINKEAKREKKIQQDRFK